MKDGGKMNIKRRLKRRVRFFTLMEMLTVIAIIALLGGIATPMFLNHLKKAKRQTARTQIQMLEQAVNDFMLDTGKFPKNIDDLLKNPGEKKWNGPYLAKVTEVPKDPWGYKYTLIVPGTHGDFDIISFGTDGVAGGAGDAEDIGNWIPAENN